MLQYWMAAKALVHRNIEQLVHDCVEKLSFRKRHAYVYNACLLSVGRW